MAKFLKIASATFAASLVLPALVSAGSYEESSSIMEPQPKTGVSLMQSGRSVFAPVVGEKLSNINEGSIDSFAAMEDEFDHNDVLPRDSLKSETEQREELASTDAMGSLPGHFAEPLLYIETVTVILTFAAAASLFRRLRVVAKSPQVQASQDLPPSPTQAAPPALFALGGTEGFAILEQAVKDGNVENCRQLLPKLGGARTALRMEDPCGCTALHTAAHCGSAGMVKMLLEEGARVDAREAWDETPLHFAARSGSVEACEALLAAKADIDAANLDGVTPLLSAGRAGKEAVCELLLNKGAGVAGMADSELPPILNALLVRRMFASATIPTPQASSPPFASLLPYEEEEFTAE